MAGIGALTLRGVDATPANVARASTRALHAAGFDRLAAVVADFVAWGRTA